MKKLLTILIFCAACSKQQIPRGTGADGNPDADYALLKKGRGKPVKDTTVVTPPTDTVIVDTVIAPILPSSYSLWTPPVINQGSEGSCNAFNTGYYARSIEHYYKTGQQLLFSPEYLFYYSKSSNTCSGSALITNLNILVEKGICTFDKMPYTWTNGCGVAPNAEQEAEAENYKIKDYSKILISDSIALKTAITQNHPLVIQVVVDNEFWNAKYGFVWRTFSSPIVAHGITIVGYDDGKHAFKVVNQWGTSWGDNGFGWIDYDLMTTVSSSAFKIIL